MKVKENDIEIIPNTGNRYATMGVVADDLQDYVIVMDRLTGQCYVEAIEEVTGKSGTIKTTKPVGGWDTYFDEDGTPSASIPYIHNAKNDEWRIVVQYIMNESQLVTTDRLKRAYNSPDGETPGIFPNIWIPKTFGTPEDFL